MRPKIKKLPYNYLDRYLGVELTKSDYEFIKGCLSHQKNYFQLNHLQWEIIHKIEKKYLTPEIDKND